MSDQSARDATEQPDELEKLLEEFGNAHFDCGMWDAEDGTNYEPLRLKARECHDRLKDFLRLSAVQVPAELLEEATSLALVISGHFCENPDEWLRGHEKRLRELEQIARSRVSPLATDDGIPAADRPAVLKSLCEDQQLPGCKSYLDRGLRCPICPDVPLSGGSPLRDDRPCTCHPDDNPPVPCPKKYALSECRAAAGGSNSQTPVAWFRIEDGIRTYYETEAWPNMTPLYSHSVPTSATEKVQHPYGRPEREDAYVAAADAAARREEEEERLSTAATAERFQTCKDHKNVEWNQPKLDDDDCILCRLLYLEAQETLLEEWQQRAKRAEAAIEEVQRPLDEQMARLNATVTRLNAENEQLRSATAVWKKEG